VAGKRKGISICGQPKKNGLPCRRSPGWGTDHEGTGACKFHGGQTPNGAVVAAQEEAGAMSRPLEVTPTQAVTGVLHLAAGQLAYVTYKVGELDEADYFEGEEGNRWVRLQGRLMDRLATFAKTAADMGIQERQVKLAEAQTMMIGKLISNVIGRLDLTPEQRKAVGPAIREEMAVIAGKATEVE
jgi:hypothetical protein